VAKEILVEAKCIRSTAADMLYFEQGLVYTIDMVWAKKRDIWKHFQPLREVPGAEAQDRIEEKLQEREKVDQERAKLNKAAK